VGAGQIKKSGGMGRSEEKRHYAVSSKQSNQLEICFYLFTSQHADWLARSAKTFLSTKDLNGPFFQILPLSNQDLEDEL
jgi:hypothetical protein